ncbi:cytochrome P450 [Nocardia sp. R16R-3T]
MTPTPTQSTAESHVDAPSFPFVRRCPFSVAEDYQNVPNDGAPIPVTFKGAPAWLVTGFDDVRKVLADSRCSVRNVPDLSRGDSGAEGGEGSLPGFFLAMDPPEHTVLRKTLAKEFTPRRMEAIRPTVQRITDQLVNEILASEKPADLVDQLALPLPSLVICELLGVPYDKHDWFQEETRKVLDTTRTPEEIGQAIGAVMTYLAELASEKMEDPGDDLISLLVHHARVGTITVPEVAGMATLLLMAGHETTGNMISLSVYTLLSHPEQLEELRRDRDLIPQAVEELLRYLDIIGNLPRTTLEPLDLNGQPLDKGALLMVAMDAANRDQRVFSDPDNFNIHNDSRGHLAFGHGIHSCLGAPLARIELQVVIETLLRRIPTLALVEKDASVKPESKIFGLSELQLTW